MAQVAKAPGFPDGPDAVAYEEMKRCMMADLGRARQEELPLNETRRGTYNPDRSRGHQRVAPHLKTKLVSGWGNPIRDEEAAQTDGLVIENAPWREGVARPVVQNITRATPRPFPTASNRPLRDLTVANSRLPPRRAVATSAPAPKRVAASAAGTKTSKIPPTTPKPVTTPTIAPKPVAIPVASSQPAATSFAPQPVATPAVVLATVPSPPESCFAEKLEEARGHCTLDFNPFLSESIEPEMTGYWGALLVRPGPEQFLHSKFEMIMYNPANGPAYADLILRSEGLQGRKHNVNRLNAPYMNEDSKCCVLATAGPVAENSYYVQLQDDKQTLEFVNSLYGLQHLIHSMKSQSLLDGHSSGPPAPHARPLTPPRPPHHEPAVVADTTPCVETSSVFGTSAPVGAAAHVDTAALADTTAPAMGELVEFDTSEPSIMDVGPILQAVYNLDQITDSLAKINFNPDLFEKLDSISKDWYMTRHPDMAAAPRLGLITSVQEMMKRHIGIKQREMIYETGVKPAQDIPESIKGLAGPITYTKEEISALRSKGHLPEQDEETMSPEDSKIVWRPHAKGLETSRWAA